MSLLRTFVPLLCLFMAGCRFGSTIQSDEQKDPYFLAGKNRLQERNYQGAIEMFEKALDVNPRSAAAHFELGVLYEQQQMDYGAALYHYQRTVMLNSNMPFAELARQRMQECKRELAKSVIQPISMAAIQQELDKLRVENQQLKQQLQQWRNYYEGKGVTLSNVVHGATGSPSRATRSIINERTDSSTSATQTSSFARTNMPLTSTRTHRIVSGDTPAAVARRYNIRLSALEKANPTMDARRLRPGQTLVIPPP
jgi:tetratricopeptide (TPR) repeat protein